MGSCFLPAAHSKPPMSLWKKHKHICAPAFALLPTGHAPESPGSESNGACIHESHRTVASKEVVLNRHRNSHLQLYIHVGPEQREQAKILPMSPWKGLNYILSHLLPEGPLSNQPASR